MSDLNSILMLLYWEVMTSGFSAPQNLPCSLESAVSPLRTSTKSYLQTCRVQGRGGGDTHDTTGGLVARLCHPASHRQYWGDAHDGEGLLPG